MIVATPQEVFNELDALSRTRALTRQETSQLAYAIKKIDAEARAEHRRKFFRCGHPRTLENSTRVGTVNGYRCRECRLKQRGRQA